MKRKENIQMKVMHIYNVGEEQEKKGKRLKSFYPVMDLFALTAHVNPGYFC